MTEIYYPYSGVPVFPRPSVEHPGTVVGDPSEMLPLVTPEAVVYGKAPRSWCHGGGLALHPVVHLYVADREGNVFLQRRSANKEVFPLLWDMSVGGHITFGETAQEALFREAEEEIGLAAFTPIHLFSRIDIRSSERELSIVYAALAHPELSPDSPEVSDGRWWTWAQIDESIGKGIFTPVLEAEWPIVKEKLRALL